MHEAGRAVSPLVRPPENAKIRPTSMPVILDLYQFQGVLIITKKQMICIDDFQKTNKRGAPIRMAPLSGYSEEDK